MVASKYKSIVSLIFLLIVATEGSIHGIHLAPRESLHEIRVTFSTDKFNPINGSAYVLYGSSDDPNMSNMAIAETLHFNDTTNSEGVQWIHTADMLNLDRGIEYSYQVYSNDGEGDITKGNIFNFTTIHSNDYYSSDNNENATRPFNILFFGDLGHNGGDEIHEKLTALPAMEYEVAQGGIDLALHMGDFAYDLDSQNGARGDAFLDRVENISAKVPYATCPGNHEIENGDFTHYRYRFHPPRSDDDDSMNTDLKTENSNFISESESEASFQMWYSLDLPNIHLVSISTEVFFARPQSEIDTMLQWLDEDLTTFNEQRLLMKKKKKKQTNGKKQTQDDEDDDDDDEDEDRQWLIVTGHRPPYCSNSDRDCMFEGSEGEVVRSQLEAMFMRQGVDLGLFAHEHSYERTFPVYNLSTYQFDYVNPKAPVYIISGSAGCNEGAIEFCLNPILRPLGDWSAYRTGIIHPYSYGHLKAVNSTHLFIDQVNGPSGEVFDELWIIQENHGPFSTIKTTTMTTSL